MCVWGGGWGREGGGIGNFKNRNNISVSLVQRTLSAHQLSKGNRGDNACSPALNEELWLSPIPRETQLNIFRFQADVQNLSLQTAFSS